MGWDNQQFQLLIVQIPGSGFTGLYVYNPALGAGNLVDSIGLGLTDPAGNVALNGLYNYGNIGGTFYATGLGGGALNMWHASSEAGPYTEDFSLIDLLQTTPVAGAIGNSALGVTNGATGVIWYPPSGDTSGVADLAAITNLWSTGFAVQLTAGTYYIDAPLTPPSGATLTGQGCIINNSLRTPAATTIKLTAGFTGLGAVVQSTVAASPIGNFTLRGIHFDLTAAATTTHGLYAISNIYGNTIEDVSILGPGGAGTGVGMNMLFDGATGQPDGWRINGLLIIAMGVGVFTQAADMVWNDVHVIQSVSDGIQIRTLANSQMFNCRSANNGGHGWNIGDGGTGTAGPDGTISMAGCNSQLNNGDGLHIQWSGTGGQMLEITGYTSVNDGQSGGGLSGVSITGGATSGFTGISGLTVASNVTGPANGILANSANANIELTNAKLWAITTPLNNVASNIFSWRAVATKTGAGAWAVAADSA